MRLNKFIANSGYTSRRKADDLIFEGQVMVNGQKADSPGLRVDPDKDRVTINGQELSIEKKVYIMLNKPLGYMSSLADPNHEDLVVDLLDIEERAYPVGRLDVDSTGLLLLTNDGQLTQKLTHPSFEVPKYYLVELDKPMDEIDIEKMATGVDIGDETLVDGQVTLVSKGRKMYNICIREGRNRQIRRMFGALGYRVTSLKRVAIGQVFLEDLAEGKYRELSSDEINYLEDL